MGCTSSKNSMISEKNEEWNAPSLKRKKRSAKNRHWKCKESQHLVALTSTTYGVLRLLDLPDEDSANVMAVEATMEESMWSLSSQKSRKVSKNWPQTCLLPETQSVIGEACPYQSDIIDTAELMAGLEDGNFPSHSSIRWCKAKMYTRSFSLSSIQAVHRLDGVLRRHVKDSAVLAKYYSCVSLPKTLCLRESDEENSKPLLEDPSLAQCSSSSTLNYPNRSSSKRKSKGFLSSLHSSEKPPRAKNLGSYSVNSQSNLTAARKSSPNRRKLMDTEISECMPLMSIENTLCQHSPAFNNSSTKKSQRKKRSTPDSSQARSCSENMVHLAMVRKSYHSMPGDAFHEMKKPIFDPELVQNFERAVEQIGSDDKWVSSTRDQKHQSTGKCNKFLYDGDQWTAETEAKTKEISDVVYQTRVILAADKHIKQPKEELTNFPWMCPPGGENCIVLYTTSLHGIRKTFEACNSLQQILKVYGVHVDERDVSMHLGFLQELKSLMTGKAVTVPRLFIKGHYIGGLEEAQHLHDDGKLQNLLEGIKREDSTIICDGCGGMRFIPCLDCSGSCKIITSDGKRFLRCPECNENGLIRCPICC